MTPDEPPPPAPSSLHRALRWSLPGAALLSIPVSLSIDYHFLQFALPPPFRGAFDWAMDICVAVLSVVTLLTSSKAVACCFKDSKSPFILLALVLVFNLAAQFGALIALFTMLRFRSPGLFD